MAFRSQLEAGVARHFAAAGLKYTYESSSYGYTTTHKYTPDFFMTDGPIIEVKGYLDSTARRTIKHAAQQNPELAERLEVWFGRACQPLSKRSATTYGGWCDKNGIKWRCLRCSPLGG